MRKIVAYVLIIVASAVLGATAMQLWTQSQPAQVMGPPAPQNAGLAQNPAPYYVPAMWSVAEKKLVGAEYDVQSRAWVPTKKLDAVTALPHYAAPCPACSDDEWDARFSVRVCKEPKAKWWQVNGVVKKYDMEVCAQTVAVLHDIHKYAVVPWQKQPGEQLAGNVTCLGLRSVLP